VLPGPVPLRLSRCPELLTGMMVSLCPWRLGVIAAIAVAAASAAAHKDDVVIVHLVAHTHDDTGWL
jgi:hypothetical protein